MKTELSSLAPASFETEMLVVFAVNKADKKDRKAEPQIELLALDTEVTSAAAKAVSGREFAGGSCETLLLHQPSGLKAARLLIVGVAKPTMAELRKAAGAAVRFAKPRGIRSLALLLPTATDFPAINTARAVIEGAIIADYDSDTYRTDRKDRSIERVTLLAPGGAAESVYKSGLN
jgi:leucyl aminopeptidase